MITCETQIKERTQLPVRWTLADAAGTPITPTTVRYRVDCLTTGQECLPWTSVTPGSPVNLTIAATVNTIRNDANYSEHKRLTLEANAGLSSGITDTADYEVVNNRFIV